MTYYNTNGNILIAGGGLAGSLLALELAKLGQPSTIIHSVSLGAASTVPLGLYNPAAAMKARKGWQAENCALFLQNVIDELHEFGGNKQSFVTEKGVLRPCMNKQMNENFLKSYHTEAWPEGWVEWLQPDEMKTRFPEVERDLGALLVKTGKTFNTSVLLQSLHTMLQDKYGCQIIEDELLGIAPTGDGWVFKSKLHEYRAPSAVLAAGSGTGRLYDMSDFRLHEVKGQVIEITNPFPPEMQTSVSAQGYIAIHDNKVVIGSTYEHHFNDLKPTAKSTEILLEKVKRTLANTNTQQVKVLKEWTGIRITTPDRLPVLGKIPAANKLYLSIGYGSKGIIYAPYCSNLLARHIILEEKLPADLSLYKQL